MVEGTPGAAGVGLAGRPEGAGEPLEDRLADVVGVPPVMQQDVEVEPAVDGERLPEVGDELAVERARSSGAGIGAFQAQNGRPPRSTAQVTSVSSIGKTACP